MDRTPLVRRALAGALLGLGVVVVARVLSGEPFAPLVAAFVAVLVADAVVGRRLRRRDADAFPDEPVE